MRLGHNHSNYVGRGMDPERRRLYELLWHLGGSQSDVAHLNSDDIDWQNHTIAYQRKKTGRIAIIHFGEGLEAVLGLLHRNGPLFPRLRLAHESIARGNSKSAARA
jgi:hypothetical protein